ncbi:flagellar basal-body MS-ring/collar protein FliF [Pontibacterium granulatum]|uniref:flagellar basal-body MS-ring/collar protein FliF n=1 Tax=Pontibacterium granulatum TaxID=2036029 RepID=UPI00249CE092|nr:flagellar basal-body MS-ring/collar protein FliF [Pontibacterium granulatum]MDI3322889.1 flagellar basal-body MS-ring/collar protein FliF [Pontibacterium granulatum]
MAEGLTASGMEKGSTVLGFNRLSIFRQIGLMVGLAATIAIGFAVVLWSQAPDYRVLFSNLGYADANQVIEQLRLYNVPYKFDSDGRAILVPEEHVHQARLKLAAEGFTADKTVGFELLDKDQGIGSSQFMETTRYRRGLEGELSRTIASMIAVRNARVHLAIPKDSVFIRDERKPSASVFIELFAGRKLERDQVSAIANLVASSIPELKFEDVTVVDQRGRLLNSREMDTDSVLAAKQLEYTQKVEERLLNRVNSILLPVVGTDRFRAEVSADIDFTAVEQTDEIYNPDLPALRSEQTNEETRVGALAAMGIPGALSNQPPGPTAVPEEAAGEGVVNRNAQQPGSSRNQATRNYELDRSISYTRHQQGRVRRLSVAVVVDDLAVIDPATGKPSRSPWSENELERLRLLVQDAVGFSARRGDSVNVINSPFVAADKFETEEVPIWKQDWVWEIVKQVLAALFVLLLVFGILRPILRNLADTGSASTVAGLGAAGEVAAELEGLDAAGMAGDQVTFGSDDELLPTPNESFDYQVNAIRSMVAEDPAKVAQAVRQWIAEDE